MKKILPVIIVVVIVVIVIIGGILALTKFGIEVANRVGDRKLNAIAHEYQEGHFEAVLPRINRYLEDYPKSDLGWTIKGNTCENLDLDDEAQKSYEQALALNPKNFQATNAMGVLARKRGDHEAAMRYYSMALELEPGYAQAYSSMSVIQLMEKQDGEALRLARLAYKNDPQDPVIVSNLAVVLHYNGLAAERDEMAEVAERLGYRNMEALKQIFSGELSIREE